MIVLDTNVLSALMQQVPDVQVAAWLDRQPAELVWITSITLFEARYGLALLASGKRQRDLQQRFEKLLQDDLENRVLPFETAAAVEATQIAAEGKARGRPVDMRDTFIAGIVLARRATLATRNLRHFDDVPVNLVDPWAGAPSMAS